MRLPECRGKPGFSRQNQRLFPPLRTAESGGVPVKGGTAATLGSSPAARALPSLRRDGRTEGRREGQKDGGRRLQAGGRNYK